MKFSNFSKKVRFSDFCQCIQFCSICTEMCHRFKVLSKDNGNIDSKIIFIAEAPGRLGADRTGIPLFGDKTGDNFENLLGSIGWKRKDVFITNAVLCNPRKENGTNRTPNLKEIRNCSIYLEMLIDLIKPELIVTLGKIALDSLGVISPHDINLVNNVAKMKEWKNYKLFPLYHPGPRAMVHRSTIKQTQDFITLSKHLDPITGLKIPQKRKYQESVLFQRITLTKLEKVILILLIKTNVITYFKLHKLLYLIDLNAINQLGHPITNSRYLRQTEGPWIPNLSNVIKSQKKNIRWLNKNNIPFVKLINEPELDLSDFNSDEIDIILSIISKYSQMTNSSIKTVTYKTQPMQNVINKESIGIKMLNKPIIDNKYPYY